MTAKPRVHYSKPVGDLVCERVATHVCGIKKLCSMYDDMPCCDTIFQWRLTHPEFGRQFAQAKMIQAELLAEDCLDICDEKDNDYKTDEKGRIKVDQEHINRARLRVDTRKWIATKLAPKIYGDSANVMHHASDTLIEQLLKLDKK